MLFDLLIVNVSLVWFSEFVLLGLEQEAKQSTKKDVAKKKFFFIIFSSIMVLCKRRRGSDAIIVKVRHLAFFIQKRRKSHFIVC